MSNFLAEAQVLIRPNTDQFRQQLQEQLRRAVSQAEASLPPITIAANLAAAGAGAGLAAATASSAALLGAQNNLERAGLGLASTENVLNSAFGRQAVLLEAVSKGTLEAAGAQAALNTVNKQTAASLLGAGTAGEKLNASLLGLRTAVGGAAVIGLGAASLAAIAFGKGLRDAINTAAQFEQEMNVLQATTRGTSEEISRASEVARQLGADASLPAVSATDAAQAITELSKAGLDLEQSLAGARGVLELAAAAQIDNAAATELAANALNAFSLAGEEAAHVADLLANASIAAQGSISDIGIALQQSAAAAAQVGISLDDTVALLTLLAQGGLRASDAGTSLRVGLLRLAAPTNQARQILAQLNIQVRDLQGNIRPEVFAEFAAATAELEPELRDAAAAAVFGQDAFRAFALISREGAEGLAVARQELARTGAAADLAGARAKGLAGDFSALKSNADTLGLSLGQAITPVLSSLVRGANLGVTGLNELISVFRDTADEADDVGVRIAALTGEIELLGDTAARRFQLAELTEEARGDLDEVLKQIKSFGGLEDAPPALLENLQRALDALRSDAANATSDVESFRSRGINAFRDFSDAATRAGADVGRNFGEAIKQALDQSVIDAINSAKANLLSLGADLADQLGQLIDAGPLGQQLERLQNSLAERRGARQRLGLLQDLEDAQRQLKLAQLEAEPLSQALERLQEQLDRLRRSDTQAGAAAALRQAQTELREARESVSGVGDVTPREQRAIQEFLAPFIENVRSAKSALQQQNLEGRIDKLNQKIADRKELFAEDEIATARRRVAAIKQAIQDFDDQAVIENLQNVIAAQKKTVADGIANLITQFNQGKITLVQFNAGLARTMAAAGIPNFKKAGQDLGAAFRAGFVESLRGLREQASLLVGFTGQTPSAGGAPSVISPQAALIESQKQTAENTKNIADNIEKLPERIAAALRRQQAPPSKAPTAGTGVR